ncbi:inositol oxygenase [Discoglossus pictus]
MKIIQVDPSIAYRPELESYQYRNYKDGPLVDRVRMTYTLMHTHQTVQLVRDKLAKWGSCTHRKMTVMEALSLLDDLVDESDPDVDFPNSFHAYQTAEGIRRAHPDNDWFHLVGLLHDLGKIMALDNEPQWAVVGDTFPVGCKFQESIVFSETFKDNSDTQHPVYSTKYGIYKPNCGLENVLMSWGHDEYMYQVLKYNKSSIPEEVRPRVTPTQGEEIEDRWGGVWIEGLQHILEMLGHISLRIYPSLPAHYFCSTDSCSYKCHRQRALSVFGAPSSSREEDKEPVSVSRMSPRRLALPPQGASAVINIQNERLKLDSVTDYRVGPSRASRRGYTRDSN